MGISEVIRDKKIVDLTPAEAADRALQVAFSAHDRADGYLNERPRNVKNEYPARNTQRRAWNLQSNLRSKDR